MQPETLRRRSAEPSLRPGTRVPARRMGPAISSTRHAPGRELRMLAIASRHSCATWDIAHEVSAEPSSPSPSVGATSAVLGYSVGVTRRPDLTPIDPATGLARPSVEQSSSDEVKGRVAAAVDASRAWATESFDARLQCLKNFAERTQEDSVAAPLADCIRGEMGKLARDARAEVAGIAGRLPALAAAAREAIASRVTRDDSVELELQWRPRGAVAVIGPWNYPVSTPNHLVLAALATGNTVVFKPSEQCPATGIMYAELLQSCLPAGVVQWVCGAGDVGRELVESPVSMVAFTGSVATGRRIMRSAADGFKALLLEMGGKDPMVILPGCDLPTLAETAVRASLANSGQVCISTERIFVHASIVEEFSALLETIVRRWKVGDPADASMDMGPMSSRAQRDLVLEQISRADADGANIRVHGMARDPGFFLTPSLITGVEDHMTIARDETFGPVVCVSSFEEESEVVARINAGEFGLGGSVWAGEDRDARRVAEQLDIGMVGINRPLSTGAGGPWVGWKNSGYGYARSVAGMRQFLRPKSLATRPG